MNLTTGNVRSRVSVAVLLLSCLDGDKPSYDERPSVQILVIITVENLQLQLPVSPVPPGADLRTYWR